MNEAASRGEKAVSDAFMCGFAVAVAIVAREWDQPTIAAGVIAGCGFSLAALLSKSSPPEREG